MPISNIVKSVLQDNFATDFFQEQQQKIIQKANQLKQIREELLKIGDGLLIQQAELSHRSQLSAILGTEQKTGLEIQVEMLEQDKQLLEKYGKDLIKLSFKAYELTSEILQELGVINRVNIVFTHRTKRSFMRAENIDIDPEHDLRLELHRGALSLRLKSASIRKKILEANQTLNNERIPESLEIQAHYQAFIEPYLAHASSGKWKPNWGVVSEAFERHWEMLKHGMPEGTPMEPNDFGSIGDRWQLYKLSSGSDPYYTGPDTEFAQVKNSNATIVSNLNTILNTMEAVLKLVFESVDPSHLTEIKAQYLRAFKQKEADIKMGQIELENASYEEIEDFLKSH